MAELSNAVAIRLLPTSQFTILAKVYKPRYFTNADRCFLRRSRNMIMYFSPKYTFQLPLHGQTAEPAAPLTLI